MFMVPSQPLPAEFPKDHFVVLHGESGHALLFSGLGFWVRFRGMLRFLVSRLWDLTTLSTLLMAACLLDVCPDVRSRHTAEQPLHIQLTSDWPR